MGKGGKRIKNFGKLFGVAVATCALVMPVGIASAATAGYVKTSIVADLPGIANNDSNLVNPWGLSHSATGPWWVSDNGMGKSTVYTGQGIFAAAPVTIPAAVAGGTGTPTGNIYNTVAMSKPSAFVVKKGTVSGASSFIFSTEDGTIAGWNKTVDSANAITVVNRSTATDTQGDTGAVYKGLASGMVSGQPYIYATNFRFGTVEMFDQNFKLVSSFTDPELTSVCVSTTSCYAPFGIQNINGDLYVTFALQDSEKHDDQAGLGHGFVDVFSASGTLKTRLLSHRNLNSPWGLTIAPQDFGVFSGDLLVGNFGNGQINAYKTDGTFEGTVMDTQNKPIQTDGLWGIAFGNDGLAGKHNELFFTAGTGGEAHGVFGKIAQP